jgi:hypothetical protein
MKKDEFNSRIRLCFESVPDDLGDDLCLVTGALIIVQKVNSKWAYDYHLKSQLDIEHVSGEIPGNMMFVD